jgi:hypothetical protein
MVNLNDGGLPPQKVDGVPARQGAIDNQRAGEQKQLSLITSTGGKRRRRMRGGTGNSSSITPPVVPNTGSSTETRGEQQNSYNELAKLSSGVKENSTYDVKVGGKKRKIKSKRRSKKTKKSRKYTKRRKYH